jgi:hypothetical protein
MDIIKAIFNSSNEGFGVSGEDIKSIVVGACINAAGVAALSIVDQVAHLNWGTAAPIATALSIVAVNMIRKFLPGVK